MYYINGKFLSQNITGVQRYALEIITELDKIVPKGKFCLVCPKNARDIKLKNINIIKKGWVKGILWEQLVFPIMVRKNRGVSVNLCNVVPLFAPDVVCIFDTKINSNPEFFSKLFVFWYRLQFSISTKFAKAIFTDSYSAKNDILKYYKNTVEKKIIVTYPGWQHFERIKYDNTVVERLGLKKGHYYFAMSSLEPNKNIKWILNVAKKNKSDTFVIAGLSNSKVFSNQSYDCHLNNVKFVGRISDQEAKSLMLNSKAFLFPSICEGFGIPTIEAISAGAKTLIVSDIPVMHEVLGDQAHYINPYSYEYVFDYSVSVTKPLTILEKYSWEKSAKCFYETLEGVFK